MLPALSLKDQTARHAVPYSDTQTGTYSRALSLNPSGLQVAGADTPDSFSVSDSVKFINVSVPCKDMKEDKRRTKKGSGEYLDSSVWELLPVNKKTDFRGRVHVNEINFGREIRFFVSDMYTELEMCEHNYLLPANVYTEVRKTRIKSQVGDPLKVQKGGDVWAGSENKNKYVKVFVRK